MGYFIIVERGWITGKGDYVTGEYKTLKQAKKDLAWFKTKYSDPKLCKVM